MSAISPKDWNELRSACEGYLSAVVNAWQDPSFRPEHIFPMSGRRSVVTTTATGEAPLHLLPSIGHPVRGMDGTKVEVDRPDRKPTIGDAISGASGGMFGKKSTAEQEVIAARVELRRAIFASGPLSRALQLISWGPGAAEHFDKVGLSEDDISLSIAAGRIERILAKSLEDQNYTVENLPTIGKELIPTVVQKTLDSLRQAVEAEHFSFSVIALLNSPPIDDAAWVAIQGSWHKRPFTLTLGYPDDPLCSRILTSVGYDGGPLQLRTLNCYIRIDYELPADISSTDLLDAHVSAGEYVRQAVDLLRLLHPDDIGIVYLTGLAGTDDADGWPVLGPPFLASFPERPNQMYRVPMRREYDGPSGELLSADVLELFRQLFNTYVLERVRIQGVPVAMERLRGIYDRYSPEEVGRLVDAVTGLEALYLPEKQPELKFRLQTRAAWFLLPEPDQMHLRVKLSRELGEIYDARSALVHTGMLTRKLKARDVHIMSRAVLILRISLLQFFRTEFGRDESSEKLGERWLELTMGRTTLKAVPDTSGGESLTEPQVTEGPSEDEPPAATLTEPESKPDESV